MKINELLQYLRSQGCDLLREGDKHLWWHNPAQNKRSAIPRHSEIKDILARKICKDLMLAIESQDEIREGHPAPEGWDSVSVIRRWREAR